MTNVASSIALSGMDGLRREMDIIANNLANANTVGFQAEKLIFKEYLSDAQNKGISYTHDWGGARNLEMGALINTENPLDVAVLGQGYFSVDKGAGEVRYTRNGHFTLSTEGDLITSQGYKVLSDGGSVINLGGVTGEIVIGNDGTVSTVNGVVARIGVYETDQPFHMSQEGEGLLKAEKPLTAVENPRVMQGALVQSNVNPVLEITRLIDLTRRYQNSSRLVENEHQRGLSAINELAKIQR